MGPSCFGSPASTIWPSFGLKRPVQWQNIYCILLTNSIKTLNRLIQMHWPSKTRWMFSGTPSTLLEVIMCGFSVFCSDGSFLKMKILQDYDRCSAFTCNSNDALWLHRLARFIHKDVGKMADRDSSRNQPNGRKMEHIDCFLFYKRESVKCHLYSTSLPACCDQSCNHNCIVH